MIAPDPPEFENLRRPLAGILSRNRQPLALISGTLAGILSRNRQPLALIFGTLAGILCAPRETFLAKLPQHLRDIGPQDGYVRDALLGVLTGRRQPLALVIYPKRESRLQVADQNPYFIQEPHSSISP
ncbi:MAG: hypothetical protein ABSB59_39290 [Streptosporangiaceae bacterium]